jgi:hypothetical protein
MLTDIETYSATAVNPFGVITSTQGSPRLIQFSARYAF